MFHRVCLTCPAQVSYTMLTDTDNSSGESDSRSFHVRSRDLVQLSLAPGTSYRVSTSVEVSQEFGEFGDFDLFKLDIGNFGSFLSQG